MEHYERQLAQNIAVIADTFESLEKIEDWTDRDKQQVEQEIESIIDTKEKQLKEKKEKKLETARKNKQPVQEAEEKYHLKNVAKEGTMKDHQGTESGATDATNNNH